MRSILKYFSFLGLALTLIPSFLVFGGYSTLDTNKVLMLAGTIIWFISAPNWMNKTN